MLQEFISIEVSLRSVLSDVIPFFPMNIYKQTTFESICFGEFFFLFMEFSILCLRVLFSIFFKARLIAGVRGVIWLCNSSSCCFFVPHLVLK